MADGSRSSGDEVRVEMAPATAVAQQLQRGDSVVGGGLRITFKELTYTVRNSANRKEKLAILSSINGYFDSGQMSALMGPSGSGKSTLLDTLAGRKTVGTVEGDVLFGGTKPTKEFLRRFTGYVEQFDTLLPTLTVHEMLLYTAELKRPLQVPLSEKKQVVEEVIDALALSSCRNTRIGNAMARGISGGQAKRTNIGISLVTNPRVLFLDEPTSGLDSFTANEVMSYVKALCKGGMTICATIHSPTSYAFSLFDRLLLLLRGKVVYFGLNDEASITSYFHSTCRVLEDEVEAIPESGNLAEWLVDFTTKGDRQGKADVFASAYEKSELKAQNDAELDNLAHADCSMTPETQAALSVKRSTVTPSWWAFWTLFRYRTLKDFRDPDWLGARIGDKILFSLVILTLYWGVGGSSDSGDYLNTAAVLFMWVTLPAFGAAAYTPALVLERPLFVRERSDGLYRVATYLCFKIFGELVVAATVAAVVSMYVWFAVNLKGSYLIFYLGYITTLSLGIVLAYLIAAVSPNMDVANAALPAYVVTLLFFSGFLMLPRDIPDYWYWYFVISPLRYAWGALMVNQFGNCCNEPFLQGMTILEYYSLDGVSSWAFIAFEFIFLVVFFVLALLALTFIRHQKR